MKKAQGISMNVIIIAAIALLVLVILSVIFMGRMGSWGQNVDDCENKGGQCEVGACPEGWQPFPAWSCEGETETCCVEI